MRRIAVLMLPLLLATVLAACGDDDEGSDSAATTTTAASKPAKPAEDGSSAAVVKFTSSTFGDILTDAEGMTLYLFTNDTGSTSACEAGCIEAWPPVTVTGTPSGEGIEADELGTTTRTDGTAQLTFHGHPIYYYAADAKPGDTNGQGVGGIWFVVDRDGNPVEDTAGSGGSTQTTKAATGSANGY